MESLRVVKKGKALKNFLLGFRSSSTMECYLKKLKLFLRFAGMSADEVVDMAGNESKELEFIILKFAEWLKGRGVSGSTVRQHIQAIKHLLVMNDLETALNWDKLSKMMPKARKIGMDRASRVQEPEIC